MYENITRLILQLVKAFFHLVEDTKISAIYFVDSVKVFSDNLANYMLILYTTDS